MTQTISQNPRRFFVWFIDGKKLVGEADPKWAVTLSFLQRCVRGHIECAWQTPSLDDKNITLVMFCNEEGRLMGLAENIFSAERQEFLVGPVVVVGADDVGNEVWLTEKEAEGIVCKNGFVWLTPPK